MVATVDEKIGQWPAVISIQDQNKKEMVSDLCSMLQSRLRLWKGGPLRPGAQRELPRNILVYRDGVSEGQYKVVLNDELPLLREACRKMYKPADTKAGVPKISIIIVGKRHHTRFYPTKADGADRSENTKSGTVVDRGVTLARNWDFFLQAHTALQGTARPAHYYVIHDEIFAKARVAPGFQTKADMIEDLTHNMCYMYGRATKAVSICPPAYYADLVCERARRYLTRLFDESNTPEASVASGKEGKKPEADASQSEVTIHDKLKNTMFYI